MNLDEFIHSVFGEPKPRRNYDFYFSSQDFQRESGFYFEYPQVSVNDIPLEVSISKKVYYDKYKDTANLIVFSEHGLPNPNMLADHIALVTNAICWNLAVSYLGNHYFTGAIAHAVGPENTVGFIGDLRSLDTLLIVKAISSNGVNDDFSAEGMFNDTRDRRLGEFLADYIKAISGSTGKVICVADRHIAQYIVKLYTKLGWCDWLNVSVTHYDITFNSNQTNYFSKNFD